MHGAGLSCLHLVVDDFSHIAYAELFPDEHAGEPRHAASPKTIPNCRIASNAVYDSFESLSCSNQILSRRPRSFQSEPTLLSDSLQNRSMAMDGARTFPADFLHIEVCGNGIDEEELEAIATQVKSALYKKMGNTLRESIALKAPKELLHSMA